MIELYDHEIVKVGNAISMLMQRWSRKSNSLHNLEMLEKDAVGTFADLGFIAHCDTLPCHVGEPPVITILDRVEEHMFDVEQKSWEVRSAHKANQKYHGEDKLAE